MAEDGTAGDADPNSPHRPYARPDAGWSSPTPDEGTEPPATEPPATAWSSPSGGYGDLPSGGPGYGPGHGPQGGQSYGPQGGYGPQQTPPPTGPLQMYGPYQPPRKSRTGLIVGLSVGAAALLLAGGLVVLGVAASSGRTTARAGGDATPATALPTPVPTPSPGSPLPASPPPVPAVTLRIPGAVAGYKQLKGSIAQRSVTEMRRKMGKVPGLSARTQIAFYTKGASHLVFVGISGSDGAGMPSELADSPSEAVDGFLAGGGINDPKDYPAGSVGGVLRCGKTRQQGISLAVCGWADASAMLTVQADRVTPKRLSAILLSFHRASVRGVIAGA